MRRRRDEVVDAAVIVVVMATILSIFDDTFADRSYLVAGLVPVVLLVAMAMVARRFHEGGWWYTLAALVLFSPLGALAALREPGHFLVPSLDSMSRVLVESVSAPTTLVSTVPPVDPTGEVMLVPYLIGFFATLPAAWLAFDTVRPLAPSVPLVTALAATIPLGVLVPNLLVPRGVFLGIVLVAWAASRTQRHETAAGGARGSVAAVATAVLTVVLMSGLTSLLVPDTDTSDRVLLSGEDNTPLVSGAPFLREPGRDDLRLFKATGVPTGQRLRLVALDLYDGASWVPAESSPGSEGYGTFKRVGSVVSPLHPGTTVVVRVRILPGYSSDWLPMLGELTSVDFDWNPGVTEVADLRYNQATSSALVVGGVDVRDRYTFESVVVDQGWTRRDATREPSDDQRQPAGAFLDEHLRPFDRDELLPLERVLLLARYLRINGHVRPTAAFDQSPDVLGRRMLGSRRVTGTTFQYSALMALAASRLGVASRVVVGAAPGKGDVVDYGDVTSWVELQFADGTWRPLDPERYVGSHLLDDGTTPPQAPDPDDFVEEQLEQASTGRDKEIRLPDRATNPDGTPADAPVSPLRVALLALAGVAALVLVALLLVPFAKGLRRARRRRTSSWSAPYVNGWQEVLDAARDRGTPVPDTWSRVAQATRLGAGLDLARRADAAVFAAGPADVADGRAFWDACQELRHALLREADVRHRAWAPFNPASLLAGWARHRSREASAAGQVRDEDRRARREQPARA